MSIVAAAAIGATTAACMPGATPGPPAPGTCAGGATYERVFVDEFDGDTLGEDWTAYDSFGPFGTGAEGRRTPEAISVDDGLLTISGRGVNGVPTTGGMAHKLNQTYGRFSVRVRTDFDPLMSWSGVVLTWPESEDQERDGENNFYETMSTLPFSNPFYAFIHKPEGRFGEQQIHSFYGDHSQWQIMTMEWTPEEIKITRQGPNYPAVTFDREVWTVKETDDDILPDAPHHLAIQLDGTRAGPLPTSHKMQVDWVEVSRYCG